MLNRMAGAGVPVEQADACDDLFGPLALEQKLSDDQAQKAPGIGIESRNLERMAR